MSKNLSVEEAMQLLRARNKCRSIDWADGEYIEYSPESGEVVDEYGNEMSAIVFMFNHEWEIYQENNHAIKKNRRSRI